MKEAVRRIQQDGYSKLLLEWMKRWRIQRVNAECLRSDKEHACVSLFKPNEMLWYCEGIVRKCASVIVELSREGVIEVNVDSHELLQVNGEGVSGIEHNQLLDLSDDGERWEGDVLQNKPYGWGVLYDSENRMAYEGFRIGNVNVCYGRSYFSDIQKVDYEGEWCEGRRWGRGVQYDRNGNTSFDGEWMNDDNTIQKRVEIASDVFSLNTHVEDLIVSACCCNAREWRVFDLSFMSHLRLLEVGDGCFENVNEVKLIGLSQLESVVIGDKCFTKQKNSDGYDSNRHFYLKSCERVNELKMGCYSFFDYSVCEIENVPSLEVIEMGRLNQWSHNFYWSSLELKSGIDDWK